MSYTVTLYFDNMVDETHFFKKEGDAAKCKAQLEKKTHFIKQILLLDI